MMMKKKLSSMRAWNVVRIALLWTRKGGAFKNKLMFDHIRTFPKFIKSLAHHHHQSRFEDQRWDDLHRHRYYGERQMSFDETPVIQFRMHRPSSLRFSIPCINAPSTVDFDYDFDHEEEEEIMYDNYNNLARNSFLKSGEEEEDKLDIEEINEGLDCCDEEGIDRKAEEFIANFYQQMKMQRQISLLQYREKKMINH